MRFSKDQQVKRNTNKMQFSPIKAMKSQKIVRSSLYRSPLDTFMYLKFS